MHANAARPLKMCDAAVRGSPAHHQGQVPSIQSVRPQPCMGQQAVASGPAPFQRGTEGLEHETDWPMQREIRGGGSGCWEGAVFGPCQFNVLYAVGF